MIALQCDVPRCSKGTRLSFSNAKPIHVKSALKATRAIIDCMSDNDVKLYLRFSVESLLSMFVSLINIPYQDFIKVLKYYTAYPLAFFLKNDLPPKPDYLSEGTKYPFPGNNKVRTWWKSRMFSVYHYTNNLHLFWSLLQGVKRACEFADIAFVTQSCEKHREVLSTADTTINGPETDSYIKNNLRLFKDFDPKLKKEYELSNSACWERKRSEGGARSEVLDITNDVYSDIYRVVIGNPISSILHAMVEVSPGRVEELRGVRTPLWQELIGHLAEKPKAMVAAILEPLKVRLITKGPAVDYFLSKPYQKALFKYLRTFPQFELIGDPLREDHLYRMIERERYLKTKGMTFSHFVSGDYSAATDNLKIKFTKLGLFSSLSNMDDDLHPGLIQALKNTLFEHEIHYPDSIGVESFEQLSGQLMGSPLSFPFLCTNNLIAYKLSLEDYLGFEIPIRELPCLINGDDILFRTNPEHYEFWKKRVKSIGFELSIGKNYIHEKVLTINSTCYQFIDNRFNKVDFCNFGLLSGTSKLGSSRGEVRDKAIDLCDAYTRSVGGASNKKLAHAKFLVRNKDDLLRVTHRGRYNLFLPRVVGGLGFPYFEGIENRITRFQACLAKLIKRTLDFTVVGFKSDSVSNSIAIKETLNKKKLLIGYGPLEEFHVPFEKRTIISTNSSYSQDTSTKFFTKIGEKYDPDKLFPFRLKSNFHVKMDEALYQVVVDRSF